MALNESDMQARKTKRKRKAKTTARKWSGRVTARSNALDLKEGIFRQRDPKKIAASLKRSAERSRRRKSDPYRSAMSMLTFYLNRAGKTLPAGRRRILERAKDALRDAFGKRREKR
jgi:hypothetical protein